MSDNTTLNSGSGGDIISTDDLGSGVKVQRVKIQYGVDGSATDASTSNPLPIVANADVVTADKSYTADTNNPLTQTAAGLLRVDASGTTVTVNNTTPANMQARIEGREAHDAVQTSFPVRIAGKYSASIAKVSADGDVVNLALTQDGKVLDMSSAPAADTTNVNSNYAAAQTNTSLVSAPGASKRLVVVEIIYSKDTAGTMKLVEDPAGTPATKFGPHYFPASGGMVATKMYVPLTANKALGITTTGGGNETITARVITENV